MSRYIIIGNWRYLIRGVDKSADLKRRFAAFKAKYPTSTLSFARWAVERGAIYCKVPR